MRLLGRALYCRITWTCISSNAIADSTDNTTSFTLSKPMDVLHGDAMNHGGRDGAVWDLMESPVTAPACQQLETQFKFLCSENKTGTAPCPTVQKLAF